MKEQGEIATKTGAKKQKLDGTNENESASSAPPYGSQEYWEERYQKTRRLKKSNDEETSETSDALPYHPWYFSYSELSPLLLPLIVGGRDQGVNLLGGSRTEENGDNSQIEKDGGNQEAGPENTSNNNHTAHQSVNCDDSPQDDDSDSDGAEYEEEEYEEDVDDDDNDDEEEEIEDCEGLAKDGPISIVEIGGGDVPLCRDLVMQLVSLEETTGAKADHIVKEVVCCDYSPSVIDLCKENQKRDLKSREANRIFFVDYITADARKLPYSDCSFDLVLEKGTLDAVLSDKENGEDDCVLIMTECARVLKERGCILLVSHLNAHTANGINWLNCVVVAGLRGAGRSSTWIVEVHGSDGVASTEHANGEETKCKDGDESSGEGNDEAESTESNEETEDNSNTETASQGPPSGSPGPAVYIIRNLTKPPSVEDLSDDYEPPTIPLRFFSY